MASDGIDLTRATKYVDCIYRVEHKEGHKSETPIIIKTTATTFHRNKNSHIFTVQTHLAKSKSDAILPYDLAVNHVSNINVSPLDDVCHPDPEAAPDFLQHIIRNSLILKLWMARCVDRLDACICHVPNGLTGQIYQLIPHTFHVSYHP